MGVVAGIGWLFITITSAITGPRRVIVHFETARLRGSVCIELVCGMDPTYYNRNAATFVDGSAIFKTAEDERSEDETAKAIETVWCCECRSFGKLAPVDWFFVRTGRMVGVGELKTRTHASGQYPTVFLNVRKWLALSLAGNGLGVPAVFVVRFTDVVKWIDVSTIDASVVRVGGCTKIVKSRNDIEPVIEVPVMAMKALST